MEYTKVYKITYDKISQFSKSDARFAAGEFYFRQVDWLFCYIINEKQFSQ